jgi:colanic acid/amylovoran biosynthesis glycosyltransferase
MKIGLVLPALPGYSETFFTNKIRGLHEAGNQVYLFVSGRGRMKFGQARVIRGPYISGNQVHNCVVSVWALLKLSFKAPVTAIKFIRLERSDGSSWTTAIKRLIINSHILPYRLDWLHFGYAAMGVGRELVGRAVGEKTALSMRGHDIIEFPLKNPGCYARLWRNVDKVHTISDDLLKAAISLGLPEHIPVMKITPAIDVGKFYSIRNSLFQNDEIIITTVARLHWVKGLGHVLDALAFLRDKGVKFTYNIIGSGEDLDYVNLSINQLGLNDKIKVFGKLEHNSIPPMLKRTDIYIQYSLSEGFCNAVLEAQAAGCLCIVSDAGGLSENALDGQTGWVVPKRRPDLLAQKILEVIQKPQSELLEISHRAAERIKAEFNLEKQRKEFVSFYKD